MSEPTKATHTAGEWYVSDSYVEVSPGHHVLYVDCGGEVIAQVWTPCHDTELREQQESNARLIASAPSLLEALEGYARMTEKALAIDPANPQHIEQLKIALRFILPATQAALAKVQGQ